MPSHRGVRWPALLLASLLLCFPASAQGPTVPILTIDEDCTTFAFGPDGRIAYAVRRIVSVRKIDMQRDDIWVSTLDGKKKRIVNGERLIQGGGPPFSYAIQSLRWAPDGRHLTVEMLTSEMTDERGSTKEGLLTLLIDDTGKEIKIRGADSVIPEGSNGAWLADGATVAYLSEAMKPRLLFSVNSVRPEAGRPAPLFERHIFAAVSWDTRQGAAVAVERDAKLAEPPKLVWLDLQKQTRRELAELPGFLGNLALSPSGTKVAYYADHETIEVRRLDDPAKPVRIRIAYGTFLWAPDESRLLLKRGVAKRSGDLMWVRLPDGQPQPLLSSLTFRDFDISPDGRYLGVTVPGKRTIQVFQLP